MMFGWLMRAETFASFRNRAAASGVFATCMFMNLMASWRSVNVLVADHTSAIPPLPSSWFSRYLPATTFPDSIFTLDASRDRHTSVDHKGMSGQVTGGIGGQVKGPSGDLVGLRVPLHRRDSHHFFEEGVVLQDRRSKSCVDEPRSDGVHADLVRRE